MQENGLNPVKLALTTCGPQLLPRGVQWWLFCALVCGWANLEVEFTSPFWITLSVDKGAVIECTIQSLNKPESI